jgi:hypothetical protein
MYAGVKSRRESTDAMSFYPYGVVCADLKFHGCDGCFSGISACFAVGLIVISSSVISFALRERHDTIFVDCQSDCQVQTRVLARAEPRGLRLIDYKAHSTCCLVVFSAFFFNDPKSPNSTGTASATRINKSK